MSVQPSANATIPSADEQDTKNPRASTIAMDTSIAERSLESAEPSPCIEYECVLKRPLPSTLGSIRDPLVTDTLIAEYQEWLQRRSLESPQLMPLTLNDSYNFGFGLKYAKSGPMFAQPSNKAKNTKPHSTSILNTLHPSISRIITEDSTLSSAVPPRSFPINTPTEVSITTTVTSEIKNLSCGPTLLTIPYEIRRMVYLKIPYVKNDQPLIYCASVFTGRKHHPLAGICRQIRAEAAELYYSSNTWLIKCEYKEFYDGFTAWIDSLEDANVNALRLLRLSLRSKMFYSHQRPHAADTEKLERMCRRAQYGYCTFGIDLSEKYENGKIEVFSLDGSQYVPQSLKQFLECGVKRLWDLRRRGELRAEHIKTVVNEVCSFLSWWDPA